MHGARKKLSPHMSLDLTLAVDSTPRHRPLIPIHSNPHSPVVFPASAATQPNQMGQGKTAISFGHQVSRKISAVHQKLSTVEGRIEGAAQRSIPSLQQLSSFSTINRYFKYLDRNESTGSGGGDNKLDGVMKLLNYGDTQNATANVMYTHSSKLASCLPNILQVQHPHSHSCCSYFLLLVFVSIYSEL